jgi:hypothetical protein
LKQVKNNDAKEKDRTQRTAYLVEATAKTKVKGKDAKWHIQPLVGAKTAGAEM